MICRGCFFFVCAFASDGNHPIRGDKKKEAEEEEKKIVDLSLIEIQECFSSHSLIIRMCVDYISCSAKEIGRLVFRIRIRTRKKSRLDCL